MLIIHVTVTVSLIFYFCVCRVKRNSVFLVTVCGVYVFFVSNILIFSLVLCNNLPAARSSSSPAMSLRDWIYNVRISVALIHWLLMVKSLLHFVVIPFD